jgi:hypothetical protein
MAHLLAYQRIGSDTIQNYDVLGYFVELN